MSAYGKFRKPAERESLAILILERLMKVIFQHFFLSISLFACALLLGCSQSSPDTETAVDSDSKNTSAKTNTANDGQSKTDPAAKPAMAGMGKMKFPAPKDMKFKDKIESNVKVTKTLGDLVFTTKDGSKIKLGDYAGKKNIILVFTEGFNGMLCPFCKTQTSRLVANYEEFKKRDCEVIVVYPGPEERLEDFIKAAISIEKNQVDKVPFPIVLDEDFAATDYFDIHSMFAHPSTYLIDKQGKVQFAYVGNDMTADRPSVKAMLERVDQLQQ